MDALDKPVSRRKLEEQATRLCNEIEAMRGRAANGDQQPLNYFDWAKYIDLRKMLGMPEARTNFTAEPIRLEGRWRS